MGWSAWARWMVDAFAGTGKGGVHRRQTSRRPVAVGFVAVLMLSYLVATSARAPEAVAAEPPPGGLVPSVANFGQTQGGFSVSDDGAAEYMLPLWVPQGRGKSTPELTLSYSSRGDNGLLGVGWSLGGLSTISWCP